MLKLNSKILTTAAVLIIVLALLYVATPLLRPTTGFGGQRTFTGQGFPSGGQGNGFPAIPPGDQGGGFQGQGNGTEPGDQGIIIQGQGGDSDGFPSQGQGNPNFTPRQFTGTGPGGLLRFGLLNGTNGIIIYSVALLIALAAAVGMLMTKNWGRILGMLMGVVYSVMALFSFLPMLLIGFMMRGGGARAGGSLNIWLTVVHFVLAIAVVVLAAISAKKVAKTSEVFPPTTTAA